MRHYLLPPACVVSALWLANQNLQFVLLMVFGLLSALVWVLWWWWAGKSSQEHSSTLVEQLRNVCCSLRETEFEGVETSGQLKVPHPTCVGLPMASNCVHTSLQNLTSVLAEAMVHKNPWASYIMVLKVKLPQISGNQRWFNRVAHPLLLRLKAVRLLRHPEA